MCQTAGTGHVTSSFSCVELMVALYYGGILNHDPKNPKWEDRDRFILSKAQASPLLYTILADRGYFDNAWLDTFAKDKFSVHLQNNVAGVEISAGSLGLGLGIACGMAYVLKGKKPAVFCMMGDAECYEGSVWEAAMTASHNNLNNLVVIIDRNEMGATDWTEKMCKLEPLEDKWKAFGWDTKRINGHNFDEIFDAFAHKKTKPYVIIADTVKGLGCKKTLNKPLYYSRVPNCEDCDDATGCFLR